MGLPEWFWFPKGEWAPVSNALIVGNYLTTLGHPAEQDLAMLARLQLP